VHISRSTFTGYWILESSLTSPQPPVTSEITIFYLHGGGYFSSQPAIYLLFLLQLAESLAQNLTVSIFALDYGLAPEHPYPSQLSDTIAAYQYLVGDMGFHQIE
jgi:monoterpene epsilon-lactone hydrolase